VTTPAADICAVVTSPCGGSATGAPVAAYFSGDSHHVDLIKNLDHFNASKPGNFSVYLWNAAGPTFVGTAMDTNAPSLSVYRVDADIPKTAAAGNYILQSVYYTNSPVHPVFYQCSDVQILGPAPPAGDSKPMQH
jgi:hypothetical protein